MTPWMYFTFFYRGASIDAFARIYLNWSELLVEWVWRVEVFIVCLFMTSTLHQPHFVIALESFQRREFTACAQCLEMVMMKLEQGIVGY